MTLLRSSESIDPWSIERGPVSAKLVGGVFGFGLLRALRETSANTWIRMLLAGAAFAWLAFFELRRA